MALMRMLLWVEKWLLKKMQENLYSADFYAETAENNYGSNSFYLYLFLAKTHLFLVNFWGWCYNAPHWLLARLNRLVLR